MEVEQQRRRREEQNINLPEPNELLFSFSLWAARGLIVSIEGPVRLLLLSLSIWPKL